MSPCVVNRIMSSYKFSMLWLDDMLDQLGVADIFSKVEL